MLELGVARPRRLEAILRRAQLAILHFELDLVDVEFVHEARSAVILFTVLARSLLQSAQTVDQFGP